MPPGARPIVFVSDFGLGNEWVGICHSVLAGISPQSAIVDLTHLIRPLEVQSGALLLADSMPYIAEDAVVLGVVDPNVGNDRGGRNRDGFGPVPGGTGQRPAVARLGGRRRSGNGGRDHFPGRRSSPARGIVSRPRHPMPGGRRTWLPECRSTSSGRPSTPRR
jgi:hypothetical protein